MQNNNLIQILSLYLIIYILDVRKMSQDQNHIELMDSYKSPSASYEDGNLTIVRYELLTRKALKAIDKEDALVIVPVGPIEVHGNFLPLGTDFMESIGWAEHIVKTLLKEKRSEIHYTLVYVPPLPIGTGGLRGMSVVIPLIFHT